MVNFKKPLMVHVVHLLPPLHGALRGSEVEQEVHWSTEGVLVFQRATAVIPNTPMAEHHQQHRCCTLNRGAWQWVKPGQWGWYVGCGWSLAMGGAWQPQTPPPALCPGAQSPGRRGCSAQFDSVHLDLLGPLNISTASP